MKQETIQTAGYSLRVHYFDTVVIGTGAAGLNAADRLWGYGRREIAIVTEAINAGTSRNTGSDKQTYYKLTLSGGEADSVAEMARTLFSGECMDGDIALAEAANSPAAFLHLCELGVEFPVNRFGEYVGYKTDHDPRRRATSVGPLTSRRMTEALEKAVGEKNIPIFDRMQAVSILTADNEVKGLLCLDLSAKRIEEAYVAFCCANIIWATGGPAGIYADSVYPHGHYGATGTALEAGATAKNLTEWQYGLASLHPRWNVSGTYMQALPRFYSVGENGMDEREFLLEYFQCPAEMLGKVFLKGYQWPFDVRKAAGGSSLIDILVYIECRLKGRRVFLDYRKNSGGGEINFASLDSQTREYLTRAGADFGTPIDRLHHMNEPAVAFYRSRGVDLAHEPLEIALCAQHNNGGVDVDAWWHTNIGGLFCAGEVAGTHGVYRPGGSALNAGQVGSMRAARYIAVKRNSKPDATGFAQACEKELEIQLARAEAILSTDAAGDNARALWHEAQALMSRVGGPIRDANQIVEAITETRRRLENFSRDVCASGISGLSLALRYRDSLICQIACLGAMADYAAQHGKSRGSALYTDPDGSLPHMNLPHLFSFTVDDGSRKNLVQLTTYRNGTWAFSWRPVRPLPEEDDFFENVWREFRVDANVR